MSIFRFLGTLSPAYIGIFTAVFGGPKIGTDSFGNVYYEAKARPNTNHTRRWVIFARRDDASEVPPEWHGWLHHQSDVAPHSSNALRRKWQRAYISNQTGTESAYLPPGHELAAAQRAPATGDYQAWQPN